MSVLEALSVGLPAVITTSNGLASDIRDSGAGRVTSSDASDLATAVGELLDPRANAVASAAAIEAVRTRFNLDHVVDQVEELYLDLIVAKSKSR